MRIPRRVAVYELVLLLSLSIGVVLYYSLNIRKGTTNILWPEGEASRKSVVSATELRDKWIVVTSVSTPTGDVEKLAAIDGWQLLVVGDIKTPSQWRHPGAIFLGVDEQRRLGYRTVDKTPWNSYTRKNVGYLYAIERGAKYIYDTDDDNHPSGGRLTFRLEPRTTGLLYDDGDTDTDTGRGVVNPYAHFGQPTIWPRGYPLESINNAPTNNAYTLCTFRTPAVQQGLVNNDPDVDAVFRMTRERTPGSPLNITFDARAPPVALPVGVFAPFNSQNTLFAYDALWALLLPTSVNFRATDIWRGYWAQRLLWLLGHRLAFCPPNAVQVRNAHDYLRDFKDEREVYADSGRLVAFLRRWRCATNASFYLCARQLTGDMAAAKFWSRDESDLLAAWIDDLTRIGYREPIMRADTRRLGCDRAVGGITSVYFSPTRIKTESAPTANDDDDERENSATGSRNLARFCDGHLNRSESKRVETNEIKKLNNSNGVNSNNNNYYDNILLIIVFNKPFPRVIPLLENVYRDRFPNVAYCGDLTTYDDMASKMAAATTSKAKDKAKVKVKTKYRWRHRSITFVSLKMESGYFGYECAVRAIEMNYAVDGYLVVGDDVLFNVWNFGQVYLSRPAYVAGAFHHSRRKPIDESWWNWWKTDMGYNASNSALDELDAIRTGSGTGSEAKALVEQYFRNRKSKSLNDTVTVNLSDTYYLPASRREMFAAVANVYLRHRVFLEIAVPTTIDGLFGSEPVPTMAGKSIWGGDRDRWQDFFDRRQMYLHPVKLSEILAANDSTTTRSAYCRHYVQQFVSAADADDDI